MALAILLWMLAYTWLLLLGLEWYLHRPRTATAETPEPLTEAPAPVALPTSIILCRRCREVQELWAIQVVETGELIGNNAIENKKTFTSNEFPVLCNTLPATHAVAYKSQQEAARALADISTWKPGKHYSPDTNPNSIHAYLFKGYTLKVIQLTYRSTNVEE